MAKARPQTERQGAAPGPAYPPGWFTEDIRAHDWPPKFRASTAGDDMARSARLRAAATQGRAESQARGVGWGTGTLTWLNGAHQA